MKNLIRYNREFKIIDTQEKAYVLGYFYGDGWINIQINKKSSKRYIYYRSSILSLDVDIIDKIINKFPFFCRNLHSNKYHVLYCYSKELFEDLLVNGVHERKSSENRNLLKIPNIRNELIPHFIRGLYDSDGGFYLYGTLIETFFCSTSYPLINQIKEWFKVNGILTNLSKRENGKNLPIYNIRTKSNKSGLDFYNLIYKDANLYMDRKKLVFSKAEMIDTSLKKSRHNSKLKATENQLLRLRRDYANTIKKFDNIEKIEYPSVCCSYHTIKSGFSYKKETKRPLFLCLKCGKRSVLNKVLLKQDELTGTPLELHTLPETVMISESKRNEDWAISSQVSNALEKGSTTTGEVKSS